MILINNVEPRLEDNTVGQLNIINYFESYHVRCVATTVILTWINVPRNGHGISLCRENAINQYRGDGKKFPGRSSLFSS